MLCQARLGNNGARANGLAMCNILSHLGSKGHWTHFRQRVYGLPYDEAAWLQFTMNNQHGPARAKKTKQFQERALRAQVTREDQKT